MVFNVENIQGDAKFLVTKEYGPDNEDLIVEMLVEVFVVVYTYLKKGVTDPVEVYTFTTDFEQALKRYKLLPACKCLLVRFLTDDDNLIAMAVMGTKPKVELTDENNSVDIKEILDRFSDDGVDRTGITCRELTEEEFSLLESENKQVFSISLNEGENSEAVISGEDIPDNKPEQPEVLHREHDTASGEEVDTASQSQEEL
jgi:hypothetical protein